MINDNKKKFESLKKHVFEANLKIYKSDLVISTFGNVSGIERDNNIIAIKPSGMDYKKLKPENMVLVSLDGEIVENNLKPSSDTKTHIELYKAFPEIKGIVHTHSRYATVVAQSLFDLKCLGTTHADYFFGDIPCTKKISNKAISGEYEKEIGLLIAETFKYRKIDYHYIKACLVASHGPFTWGLDLDEAVFTAIILEEIARQYYLTKTLNREVKSIQNNLIKKHYFRKHGMDAYYGQKT